MTGAAGPPLAGVRVVEFAGIGPAPFCTMLFTDLGADVIRIDRPGDDSYSAANVVFRGRPSIELDLKSAAGRETALRLCEEADILIEGYRPGVMERFGLGPDTVHARNASLVYGRMTGWGQTGPRAHEPGHDINYIALTGALHAIGTEETPVIPTNLVGDFGGGALYLAFGILAALLDAQRTGKGRVVDCAMVDGSASLMTMAYGWMSNERWLDRRRSNSIDGGSHFYNVYQCACGNWLAVGAIEPKFYANLLHGLDLDPAAFPQRERTLWPDLRAEFARVFKTRTRGEWLNVFDGREACVTPVHSMAEAMEDPHLRARRIFGETDGVRQPLAAPRFSGFAADEPGKVHEAGEGGADALARWGFDADEIRMIAEAGKKGR